MQNHSTTGNRGPTGGTQPHLKTADSTEPEYVRAQLQGTLLRLTGKKAISIIVPVYSADEDTKNCIESIAKYTILPHELILINHCRTDEKTEDFLKEIEGRPFVKVLPGKTYQGFVKTGNIGTGGPDNDVVLLKGDTIVTPRWLEKMVLAAYSKKEIATVTPLSNAYGVFSVPEIHKKNEIPADLGINGMGMLVERLAGRLYPEVPAGNCFCLYIKREALNDVGLCDTESVGSGYTLENDFCMRALKKGWKNIVDDSTFIYRKENDYSRTGKKDLTGNNPVALRTIHPEYPQLAEDSISSEPFVKIRKKIGNAVKNNIMPRKRILYVLHLGGRSGTSFTSADLMHQVNKEMGCFLLTSSTHELVLCRLDHKGSPIKLSSWKFKRRWDPRNMYDDEYRSIYFWIIIKFGIDIVHIHHLLGHSFDLPLVAHDLKVPVVLSFHDFYFICPSVNLLMNDNRYCGGKCSNQVSQCKYLPYWLGKNMDNLSSWNEQWRKEVMKVLPKCSFFVTPSESTRKLYQETYGELDKKLAAIEHGRDFSFRPLSPSPPVPGGVIRILFPGNINHQKGLMLIKSLKEIDTAGRLEFHVIGTTSEPLDGIATVHGPYERDDFFKKVKDINPSFIGVFSIWPETYCYVLSEAWACGIPVFATKLGALEERLLKYGGGWFVDHNEPYKAYETIIKVSDDAKEYETARREIRSLRMRNTREMAHDYMRLYKKFLQEEKCR